MDVLILSDDHATIEGQLLHCHAAARFCIIILT
jgi:hypothetical protein